MSSTDWTHAFKPDVRPCGCVNRFMVILVLANHMQALSAFQPRSQRVHGYPDKVWSFWQSDEVATLRLLPYHQRGFMAPIAFNNLTIANYFSIPLLSDWFIILVTIAITSKMQWISWRVELAYQADKLQKMILSRLMLKMCLMVLDKR